MTKRKYALSAIFMGVLVLSGCGKLSMTAKPSEKEILAAFKLNRGFGFTSTELPDSLCVTLPKGTLSSVLTIGGRPAWTATIPGEATSDSYSGYYLKEDSPQKFEALVTAGLLKKENYKVYKNLELTDVSRYSLTSKGTSYLTPVSSDWSGRQKCFKAAKLNSQKLIPSVNEKGESLSDLVVENKNALGLTKEITGLKPPVYRAWISSDVSNVADWAKTTDIQSAFKSELAQVEKPKVVSIDVVRYEDMWLPLDLAMRLNAQMLSAVSQKLTEDQKKRISTSIDSFKKEYAKSIEKSEAPSLSPAVITQLLRQAETAMQADSATSEYPGVYGKSATVLKMPLTEPSTQLKSANMLFFSSDPAEILPVEKGQNSVQQLEADFKKLSKVSLDLAASSVGTELKRKINMAKNVQDQRLNKRKEILEFLDLLVENGLAKKTELKKGEVTANTDLTGKQGITYELDPSITIKSERYNTSELSLKLFTVKFTDVKAIKPLVKDEKQKFVLTVGTQVVALDKAKELLDAHPELIALGKEMFVTVQFTGNPSEPYKILSVY